MRDACRLLDVSDTTLRQWADAGHLRVYRTPGGHRRFLRHDVESLTQAARPSPDPSREDSGEGPALRRDPAQVEPRQCYTPAVVSGRGAGRT